MPYKKVITAIIVGFLILCSAGQVLAARYTIKSGDSLYSISHRFNTTVNSLMKTNSLKSSTIYPGQVLTVPSSTSSYQVKSGDSLYTISRRFNTTVNNLKQLNGLKSTYLYPGQVLKVPAVTAVNYASRGASSYPRSQVLLLARLINGEARGETYEGQVAVGAVVLNRVDSSKFPNTISGVIYQSNEFSVVNDGQINLTPSGTAIKAAEAALNGWDPSKGALYYWNPAKASNKFLNSRTIVARIGNHVFAK